MTEQIQNFKPLNPFDDTGDENDGGIASSKGEAKIHIRVQQRNGRKTLTTVQGLPKDLDPKRVLKVFKKEFACNGTIVEDEEHGGIVQLQGDHRAKVSAVLVEEGICKRENIQVHGF